ncbi:monocarboxylate transporter 12-B-like isoform X1 [Mytilus californianus]|uniref:monocarboxylate transporter 12-B-like isoform X1 n=2 Tax=Mytilus californianus TaxID=6549 RepID=UPI002245E321|nr:monocarboxylate transporter 12-B-like isoform X1 [Mytilus californianus]
MAEQRGVPYDRGWAWMIVVGYFASSFIMVGVAKSYGILMKPLMEEFDVDITIASLGMAVGAGIYTLAAPVFVALGQHFTERSVVMFGAVFACVFISLCYFKIGIWYLIWMYGIGAGIGNSCLFGNGLVMIGSYFKRIRTVANGVALSGASVGTFVIPPLMEFLLQTYGLPGTYLILGGLYLSVAVCGALYRPLKFYTTERKAGENDEKHKLLKEDLNDSTRKRTNVVQEKENQVVSNTCEPYTDLEIQIDTEVNREKSVSFVTSTGSLVMGSMESLAQVVQADESKKLSNNITIKICGKSIVIPKIFHFSVLKMPEVVFYTIFSFLVFFGYFNFIIFMPLDAASRGFESFQKAWLVSCAGIGDLIGRIVVGIVGDLRIIERYKIIGATCIFCGINILIFNFATVFWWCAIHTTLYGFFGGAYVALTSIVLIDMVGLEIMPKAIGVILLIQGLGAAIGQPVEGAIKGRSGSFSLLNYINSSLMIIGGFFMFLYPLIRDAKKSKNKNDTEQEEEEA